MKDKNGRDWAKLSEIKEGDIVKLDGGFTCSLTGKTLIHKDENGLYFLCDDGHHYLSGQADDGEHLIGIYPYKS